MGSASKFSILKALKKLTLAEKAFYSAAVAVLVIVIANYAKPQKEGFEKQKEFTVKTGPQVFDDFYVSVYDDLLYSKIKNNYEIGRIINVAGPTEQSRVLDVGSGTGHHVALLSESGYDALGLDVSPAMIQKAKRNYPSMNFMEGDALNGMLFPPNSFTLITCLYFTIYYMQDKARFFDNCMKWLMPGGCLAVHLVDKANFDPIIPAGDPLAIISAQSYAKERITSTEVDFDTHEYKANFELQGPSEALLHETFKCKNNGSIRKNEHRLYMESQKKILAKAKAAGFIFVAQIDLIKCEYEHQYIYILQKPN